MVVGRLLSYWKGNFSRAMLNFGRVNAGEKKHIKVAGVSEISSMKKYAIQEGLKNLDT